MKKVFTAIVGFVALVALVMTLSVTGTPEVQASGDCFASDCASKCDTKTTACKAVCPKGLVKRAACRALCKKMGKKCHAKCKK